MNIQPTIVLTGDQIATFRTQGFLSLDQISTPGELARLREIYDRMFEGRDKLDAGVSFDLSGESEQKPKLPQILDPSSREPSLKNTLIWANARAIMEQLLGGELAWQGDHAILKPAGYGAPTPWHQDEAYWDPGLEHASLSVWVPLQDVDERSGCMCFVPGSHEMDVLPHQPIGNDPMVHGLELASQPELLKSALAVPLKAGGCTIHQQRTLHYAPGNVSDIPRRAYIVMGGLAGRPLETPRRFEWQERQRAGGAPASR